MPFSIFEPFDDGTMPEWANRKKPMTEGDNRPWSEQYYDAGQDWADREAAASLLEDTKSAVLAERVAQCGDVPVNRAETTIKASPFWKEHIGKIIEARRQANLAKIKLEFIRMKAWELNNEEANHRAGSRI